LNAGLVVPGSVGSGLPMPLNHSPRSPSAFESLDDT
jgi:hypothetical protein